MATGSDLALPYERFAGLSAIAAAVAGFLYAATFVVLRDPLWSSLCLLLAGLLATPALVGVYERLRAASASWALLALILAAVGALGSAVHAGYDLANAINPPASVPDVPNPVDPRGLLTFGVSGLGLLVLSWLIARSRLLPPRLGWLGYLLAALLLVLYLARLIVLDATSPIILIPVLLTGFIVNPLWYGWLGAALWREASR
jgi:hypothetical protein